jgi:hypothetical protein
VVVCGATSERHALSLAGTRSKESDRLVDTENRSTLMADYFVKRTTTGKIVGPVTGKQYRQQTKNWFGKLFLIAKGGFQGA